MKKLEMKYLKLNDDINSMAIIMIIGFLCMFSSINLHIVGLGFIFMVVGLIYIIIESIKLNKIEKKLNKFYLIERLKYYKRKRRK